MADMFKPRMLSIAIQSIEQGLLWRGLLFKIQAMNEALGRSALLRGIFQREKDTAMRCKSLLFKQDQKVAAA